MPSSTVELIGHGGDPVVVIDDFHPEPDRLREAATRTDFARRAPHYPGVQAPANPAHLRPVLSLLGRVLEEVFGANAVDLVQCAFSLVTVPDAGLTPFQRLPHIDTPDPGRIALLHYLSGEETGGTAFYRHRATALDALSAKTFPAYKAAVEAEGEPKPGYMRGGDGRFEMIHTVEARPNRAVLYRSRLLHSGMIPEDLAFSDDPATGRLTVNTFFQARP